MAFGDSLTIGLGLLEQEAYPALLQRKIDEAGYEFEVVNAGVSGDTSAGGLRRLDWALEGEVRVLIVAFGGNDGLRGLPVSQMKENLSNIIDRARERNVVVILAGMEAPPNFGQEYAAQFREAFRDVALGSGKSTLLGLLAGLDAPTSGTRHPRRRRHHRARRGRAGAAARQKIGFVFQFFHLLPSLTALENVLVPMEIAGAPGAAARATERCWTEVGLSGPRASLPVAALGRRAAARRDRARPGQRSADPARRRAHRQPGQRDRPLGDRAPARREPDPQDHTWCSSPTIPSWPR